MISIYLDTSIINFLFADDVPEKKKLLETYLAITLRKMFMKYSFHNLCFRKIEQTTDKEKKKRLFDVINKYPLRPLIINDILNVEALADLYVKEGITPAKKRMDALHVACIVLNKIDYLVSWNYKHYENKSARRSLGMERKSF